MAAQSIRIDLTGDRELIRRLRALGDRILPAAASALHQEHERIMTEAKTRTPVETGALRNSGRVSSPEIRGSVVISEGGFGDSAVKYAIHVHERLDLRHPVGQAKFYESVVLEAASGMEARLGQALRSAIERLA